MVDLEVRNARPHLVRAGLAAVVAIVGTVLASVSDVSTGSERLEFEGAPALQLALFVGGAALVLVGGFVAARSLGAAIGTATARVDEGDPAHTPLARLVTIAGYVLVVLWVLSTFGIDFSVLLLGGALSGIILGIAAQQTLGNIFAGIVLLIVRPFRVGEYAILKSSLGEYAGIVTNMGFFYVHIETEGGWVELPNAVALASAVGPGARPPSEDASDSEDEGSDEEEPDRTSAEGPIDRPEHPEAP